MRLAGGGWLPGMAGKSASVLGLTPKTTTHGLFLDLADAAIIGGDDGVEVLFP